MMSTRFYLLLALLATLSACSHLRHAGMDSPVEAPAAIQTGSHLPPPLEAKDCGASKDKRELPKDRFARKGGKESEASGLWSGNLLTVEGIEQGRDLNRYERLDVSLTAPWPPVDIQSAPTTVRARSFLWEHWRGKKPGYLTITGSSVDATSISHIFVEEDETGRWRVAWRIVHHTGHINDLPTYYGVEWVRPAGWNKPGLPLRSREKPDPKKHELEFRDKCGEVEKSF
jgi:hypothetical protein